MRSRLRRNSSPQRTASAHVSTAPSFDAACRQPDRLDVQLCEELDELPARLRDQRIRKEVAIAEDDSERVCLRIAIT